MPLVVQPSNRVISKGVAVILSETQHSLNNQRGLSALAPWLNDMGWVTLHSVAPNWLAMLPSASTTEQTTDTSTEDTKPITEAPAAYTAANTQVETISQQQVQALQQQMQAIANAASQYSGFFLVISEGTSAAWLTQMYSQQQLATPDALVAIGSFWPQQQKNQQLPELIANSPMPLLDIISPWDNRWSYATQQSRKIAAEKALKLHYRQRELIGQYRDPQQVAFLAKQIYGWLTYMGW